MSPEEKPKQSTISQSLSLLSDRGILVEEKDHFRLNDKAKQLIGFYSNSIRHFRHRDKVTNPDETPQQVDTTP